MKSIKPKIFINYQKDWYNTALDLSNRLINCGCEPWLDTYKLLPGSDWETTIAKAINNSDIFLACISPNYESSKGFRHVELKMAYDALRYIAEGQIFVIPVKLHPDSVIPYSLKKYQWLNLFELNSFEDLLKSIELQTNKSLKREQKYFHWNPEIVSENSFSQSLKNSSIEALKESTKFLNKYLRESEKENYRHVDNQFQVLSSQTNEDVELTLLDSEFIYKSHSNKDFRLFRNSSFNSQWSHSQGGEFAKWIHDIINNNSEGVFTWVDKMSSNLNKEQLTLTGRVDGYSRKTISYFRRIHNSNSDTWVLIIEGHQSEYR